MKKRHHKHTQHAIKTRGEVFTPTPLVNEMLDKLPLEVFSDPTKTFLDNSCGDGQFLHEVMMRKMKCFAKRGDITPSAAHEKTLSTIYGCELDFNNAEECRQRLLKGSVSQKLRAIVDHNVICADALDHDHPGWKDVGFYWDENDKPNVEKYNERKKKEAEEAAKTLMVEKVITIETLPSTKVIHSKPVQEKSIPSPVVSITTPVPIVRYVTEKEFIANLTREATEDDCF